MSAGMGGTMIPVQKPKKPKKEKSELEVAVTKGKEALKSLVKQTAVQQDCQHSSDVTSSR
jgi:hypothetical protein